MRISFGVVIGAVICQLLTVPAPAAEQPDSSAAPIDTVLGLVITSRVDTLNSNRQALQRYWGHGLGESLTETLDRMIRDDVKSRIDPLARELKAVIPILTDSAGMKLHPNITRWIYLTGKLTVDNLGWREYRPELVFTDTKQLGQSAEQALDSHRVISMIDSRQSIAAEVADKISEILARWLTEKRYKIRVVVDSFKQSGADSSFTFLGDGLQTMVESELARSDAFLVYSGTDSNTTGPIARLYANYRIDGSFMVFDGSVRADIRCLKLPSGHILMSRTIIPKTVNLNSLSGEVSLEINRMKRLMLTDHTQQAKSLAIVAVPPGQYFKSAKSKEEVNKIARLFRRNLINRLKQLAHEQKLTSGKNLLDVVDDDELLDSMLLNYHAPGEMISELSADYLVTLKIEDMGQRLRVSTTLHSYITDPPAVAEYIYAGTEKKACFKELINRTLFHLARELCQQDLFEDDVVCSPEYDSLSRPGSEKALLAFEEKATERLDKATKDIRVLDIRANKAFGWRVGGALKSDDALYFGSRSRSYVEICYAHLLPHPRGLTPELDVEIETSIGMDVRSGNILRHGATCLYYFTEGRLVITWLAHSFMPVTGAIGGGLGFGNYRVILDGNESPLAQSAPVKVAEVRGLWAVSARAEFPVVDWLRFEILCRYHHQFGGKVITNFEDVTFDDSVHDPVRGKLRGWYIISGIRFMFK